MLSYQHIYHAGNMADIQKHLWLLTVLDYLRQKEGGMTWVDTHGGRGLYDLECMEAQKLGEHKSGFFRLQNLLAEAADLPSVLRLYGDLVRACNGHHSGDLPRFYPGSALLAAHMLRPQDIVHAFDLHPQESGHLRAAMAPFSNACVRQEDGYKALKALLPPVRRRGGVLFDPSYEIKSEYDQVFESAKGALAKWPQGVFMIWYPLLPAGNDKRLKEQCAGLKAEIVVDEWIFRDPATDAGQKGRGLYGSGMIIINPPYTTPQTMQDLKNLVLPVLCPEIY